MKTFVFKGDMKTIGQQHGKLLLEYYDPILFALNEKETTVYTRKTFFSKLYNLFFVFLLQKNIAKFPLAKEYIDGLLSVSAMTPIKLFGLLIAEVFGSDKTKIANMGGCSGFSIKLDAEMLVGKNFDFNLAMSSFQGLLIRRQRGYLSYGSFAPLLMPIAGHFVINEEGLILSYNYAYSKHGIYLDGVPISIIIHEIVSQCCNVNEAISFLRKRKIQTCNGGGIMMVDKTTGVLVELFGKDIDIIGPSDKISHTNHFQTEVLKKINIPDAWRFNIQDAALYGKPINLSSRIRLNKIQNKLFCVKNLNDAESLLREHSDPTEGLHNIFQTNKFWCTISSLIGFPERMEVIYYDDIRNRMGRYINFLDLF